MAMGVSVTERAAARIKELIAAESREGQGLRVKVVGGGCSGLQYKVDFDAPKATDKVFEKDGAKVLVDMKSLLYLSGTELDYKEELMQSGFVFQNPNVRNPAVAALPLRFSEAGNINENGHKHSRRSDPKRVQVRFCHRYRSRHRSRRVERRCHPPHFGEEERAGVHAGMAAESVPTLGQAGKVAS